MQSLVSVCGLLLIVSVHAHVVTDLKECKSFLYKGFVPQGFDSKNQARICQFYENKYYFVTLYDTGCRIPVYSAYVFENKKGDHPESPWCVEPQLVDESCDKKMMTYENFLKSKCGTKIDMNKIGEKQAVDEDYNGLTAKGYNRGHLNPRGHHVGDASKATYTMTNAVPQNAELNRRAWAQYENKLKDKIFKDCDEAYVLVGAIPSADRWIKRDNVNRVNIPDYLWHAYCCVKRNKPIKNGAATAKNTDDNTDKSKVEVQELDMYEVKTFLKNKLGKNKVPTLFENDCKVS